MAGSIFSGGGLGGVGVEWGAKIPVLAACELIPSRAALIRSNFPDTKVFEGDIWDLHQEYVSFFRKALEGRSPWLITLSPPAKACLRMAREELHPRFVREVVPWKTSVID